MALLTLLVLQRKVKLILCVNVNYAQMTVREALNSALDEEMSADPTVFLMGEEVGHMNRIYSLT